MRKNLVLVLASFSLYACYTFQVPKKTPMDEVCDQLSRQAVFGDTLLEFIGDFSVEVCDHGNSFCFYCGIDQFNRAGIIQLSDHSLLKNYKKAYFIHSGKYYGLLKSKYPDAIDGLDIQQFYNRIDSIYPIDTSFYQPFIHKDAKSSYRKSKNECDKNTDGMYHYRKVKLKIYCVDIGIRCSKSLPNFDQKKRNENTYVRLPCQTYHIIKIEEI